MIFLLLIIGIKMEANHATVLLNDNNCGISMKTATNYIIGGTDALSGEFPFMVSLQYKHHSGSHFCGATLINDRWLLTAAHCVDTISLSKIIAVFGTINKHKRPVLRTIDMVIIHGCWEKKSKFSADIALLKTNESINMTEFYSKGHQIGSVCLPPQDANPINNEGIIIGWGISKEFGLIELFLKKNIIVPDILIKAKTNLYPLQYCNIIGLFETLGIDYEDPGSNIICIRSPFSTVCMGDSGGPLLQVHDGRYYQIGITSFGTIPCAKYGLAYYTDVAHYRQWIVDSINLYGYHCNDVIKTVCD